MMEYGGDVGEIRIMREISEEWRGSEILDNMFYNYILSLGKRS